MTSSVIASEAGRAPMPHPSQFAPPSNIPMPSSHHESQARFGIDSLVECSVTTLADEHPASHHYSARGLCSPLLSAVDGGGDGGNSEGPGLVATLFYKAAFKPSMVAASSSSVTRGAASEVVPANMAPTDKMESFPLEPPTVDAEVPLDHLYGSYVSQPCITAFVELMLANLLVQPPVEGTASVASAAQFPHSGTCGGENISPAAAGGYNVITSHRSLEESIPGHPRVVEVIFSLRNQHGHQSLQMALPLRDLRKHELLYRFERDWGVEVTLQADMPWRRYPRLVVFDMDSTLITQEVIDLMATAVPGAPADLGERIADVTRRTMNGELEFEASFRERVRLLSGVSEEIFTDLRSVINVTNGVVELMRALKRLGVKTAVLSGGFQPLTSWLAMKLGMDHAYANDVVIVDGILTGEARGVIVGREQKRDLLLDIARHEGIDRSQVVAIGDGANDLLMLDVAGLGVAWHAKPRVQLEAAARLDGDSMLDLLYLFGFTSREINILCSE